MNPKINYVIATWDGKDWNDTDRPRSGRSILDEIGSPKADEILALHLTYLSKLRHLLSQITIMKPTEHKHPRYENYYRNAEKALESIKFSCPVVWIQNDHYKQYSYGQWFHAYEHFRNKFDYYIFVEDDTVAAIPYFDIYLMTLFQHRIPNQFGYLCTKATLLSDYRSFDSRFASMDHAAISTGITNSQTLAKLFETYGESQEIYDHLQNQLTKMGITNHPFTLGDLMQVNFSLLFMCIRDYSNMFSCPFWIRDSRTYKKHTYKEYATEQFPEPLIVPVTMVVDGSVEKFQLLATLGFLEENVAIRRMKLIGINAELQQLDLSAQHLDDKLLTHIFASRLQILNLSNNLISDVSMELFLKHPLTELNLNHTHVSDDGVEILSKHKTLEYLHLRENNITTIECLKHHPTLRHIEIDEDVQS